MLVMIFCIYVTWVSCENNQLSSVPLDLLECIQKNQCGVKSVCKFNVTTLDGKDYDANDVTLTLSEHGVKNCNDPSLKCTDGERRYYLTWMADHRDVAINGLFNVKGHVMMLFNALDHVVDFAWDVIGNRDLIDDKSTVDTTHHALLPKRGFAYFDTHVTHDHTVRLLYNGATFHTESSTDRVCTRHEACNYMLRICSSTLTYAKDVSVSLKIDCMSYARACNYFSETMVRTGENDGLGSKNDNQGNGYSKNNNALANANIDASNCLTDCMYTYYDPSLLPKYDETRKLVDSVDVLRRLKLGLNFNVKQCNDKVKFVGQASVDPLLTEQEYWEDPKYHLGDRYSDDDHKHYVNYDILKGIFIALIVIGTICLVVYATKYSNNEYIIRAGAYVKSWTNPEVDTSRLKTLDSTDSDYIDL